MNGFDIRPARDDDTTRILQTLRASLGETPLLRRTPELWAWKHAENPFGASIVLVAEAEDRIAGVRAMMRWNLITRAQKTLNCLRPVDTATHPDFMRRGIFKELTEAALDIARDTDVDLVFNTPNKTSRPGYLKMGWSEVESLGVLVRPRFGSAFKPTAGQLTSLSAVAPTITRTSEVSLETKDRPPLGLRTPRTEDYLQWRFQGHPTAEYGWVQQDEAGGLVARAGNRHGRTELVISDLLGAPGPGVIRRAAHKAHVRYLAGWFSSGSPERLTALRAGMIPVPWLRTLRLVALPLADLDVDVFDLRSWDLSTSDLELL